MEINNIINYILFNSIKKWRCINDNQQKKNSTYESSFTAEAGGLLKRAGVRRYL